MKLDLHILVVTLYMYFKFQANTFSSFINIRIQIFNSLKIKNISKTIFLLSSVTLTLSRQKGNIGSAHPLVEVNI